MTEERILIRVKETFKYAPHIGPSQFASFIFFMVKSGMVLFDDTQIDSHLLSGLIEKDLVKYDANGFHQLEACIRYKFKGLNIIASGKQAEIEGRNVTEHF